MLLAKSRPNEINRLVFRSGAKSNQIGRSTQAPGLFQQYPPLADIGFPLESGLSRSARQPPAHLRRPRPFCPGIASHVSPPLRMRAGGNACLALTTTPPNPPPTPSPTSGNAHRSQNPLDDLVIAGPVDDASRPRRRHAECRGPARRKRGVRMDRETQILRRLPEPPPDFINMSVSGRIAVTATR